MRLPPHPSAIAALLLATCAITLAQQPPTPSTPAATAPDWPSLLSRLASDNFAQREAAQKDLDKLTWRDHDQLKTLAESTPDPEAKSRLAIRLTSLDEQMALDPPPISVDLRGASFPEIIHALETVTGESFNNSARNGLINPDQTFTLSATEKPFWEIVRDLSGQHGLQIHGRFGLSVFQAAPGLRLLQITGPLIAYDPVITSTTYFEPRNIPGQPAGQIPAFSLSYSIALDPRLKVAKFIPPQLFEIVDDAGTVLLQQQPPPGPPAWNVNARATLFTAGQLMPKPEKIGKTIASAKGRFIVTVRLAAETADVANIDARLKQPINLAGQTVVISEFIPLGNTIRLQLSRDYEAGAQNQTAAPMSATLIDSTGEPFWSSDLPLGSTSQTINAARPPYKIQFTVTTKSKELALPFELKNIPIP